MPGLCAQVPTTLIMTTACRRRVTTFGLPAQAWVVTVLAFWLSLAAGCGRSTLLGDGTAAGQLDAATTEWDTTTISCVAELPASCVPGPREPASLALLHDLGDAFGIVPFGDRVIAGGSVDPPIDEPPRGRFVIIDAATGALTSRDLQGRIPAALWSAGPALVYLTAIPNDTLVRWDLDTGQEVELSLPAGATVTPWGSVAVNAKGQVFWRSSSRNNRNSIAMWEPCTGTSSLMAEAFLITSIGADSTTLYWTGKDGLGPVTVSFMPIAGGLVSSVAVSTYEVGDLGLPRWVGVDDTSFYYTAGVQTPRIGAMPKTGGSSRTVVSDARPLLELRFDDANIYWVDESAPGALRRSPKNGGQTDILWSSPQRRIRDIAVDGCNVYWVVANPFEVFYRTR